MKSGQMDCPTHVPKGGLLYTSSATVHHGGCKDLETELVPLMLTLTVTTLLRPS